MKITSQPAKNAIFVDYQRLTMMVGACYPVLSFFNDLSGFIRMRHRPAYLEIYRGISRILGKRIKSLISAHVSFSVWVTLCRNATCVAMTSIGTGRGQPQFGMFGARWCQSHFDVPIFLFEIQVQKGEV